MGMSLRVKHDEIWNTVEAPYIMEGGAWKMVHKVWVMNGGVWNRFHKTPYTKYTLGEGGQAVISTNGTWTVPENTRYIKVTIYGHGGGGGGGSKTNAYHPPIGAYRWTTYQQAYSSGGDGGSGGHATVILETTPGTVFTWDRMSSDGLYPGTAGVGGDGSDTTTTTQTQGNLGVGMLTLQNTWESGTTPPTSVGTAMQAISGSNAADIRFYGDSPTANNGYSLVVGGGDGGSGGKLEVSSIVQHPSGNGTAAPIYAYGVNYTTGVKGAGGTVSWTSSGGAGNLISSVLATGGGNDGGEGGASSADTAPDGTEGIVGSIAISTYQDL